MCTDEAAMLEQAVTHLHMWTTADFRFDEHIRPIRYVFASDGRIVAPAMAAMLQATETVLHVPVADESAMEVLVSLEVFDEDGPTGALVDRWRIYHGDPPDVNWVLMSLDLARFHGMVIDAEGLQQANPLSEVEPRLCGEINREHADAIRVAIAKHLDVEAQDPRIVGIDPRGIDIRAKFDVVRLPLDPLVTDADAAPAAVRDLLGIQ